MIPRRPIRDSYCLDILRYPWRADRKAKGSNRFWHCLDAFIWTSRRACRPLPAKYKEIAGFQMKTLPALDLVRLQAHHPSMKVLLTVIVMGLCCLTARAEDWTVNGKTYHNVTVTKVEPDKVHIMFDGGIGSVNLSDLPPDLQKRFNYDPQAAKVAEKAEADRLAELDREHALEAQKQAKIAAAQDKADAKAKDIAAMQKTAVQIPVQIMQVLPDGVLCEKQQINQYTVSSPVSGNRSEGFGKAPASATQTVSTGTGVIIFVTGVSQGLADGQQLSFHAYRDGTYSYTDTQSATRTVEKWVFVQ